MVAQSSRAERARTATDSMLTLLGSRPHKDSAGPIHCVGCRCLMPPRAPDHGGSRPHAKDGAHSKVGAHHARTVQGVKGDLRKGTREAWRVKREKRKKGMHCSISWAQAVDHVDEKLCGEIKRRGDCKERGSKRHRLADLLANPSTSQSASCRNCTNMKLV